MLWSTILVKLVALIGIFVVSCQATCATHGRSNSESCSVTSENKLVLHYWPIKARNWWPLVVAAYGDLPLNWVRTTDEWYKEKTPFGLLPVLYIDDFILPQSLTIGRYIAGLAKLEGETLLEKAKNDVLIQEMDDILGFAGKAHYAPDRKAAMDALFGTKLPKVFQQIEALMNGETFAGNGKVLSGDLAIFSALDILIGLQPDMLDATPKLKQFYEKLLENPKIKKVVKDSTIESYYQRQ